MDSFKPTEKGTPLAELKKTSSIETEKGVEKAPSKSELICGKVATMLEPEKMFLQLSPGLNQKISWQSVIVDSLRD